MHSRFNYAAGLIALTAMLTLAGCNTNEMTGGNPYPPVPNNLQETIPKPPVTSEPLMWQPGHWDWNGSGYIWAQGQFVPAAGHGNMWMPGWWSKTGGGWSWQPAHWMS